MLTNPVDVPEYVLLSEELYRTSDTLPHVPAHEVSQDLEGIGPVRSYYVDVAELAGASAPLPEPSLLGRVGKTLSVAGSGMPYMLGLRRRRRAAPAV
jgi:hypothetical protein